MKFGELNLGVWKVVQFPYNMPEAPISSVFTPDTSASVVYANYMTSEETKVAVRESPDSEWQGDLTTITAGMLCWFLDDNEWNESMSPDTLKEDLDKLLREIYSY